MIYFDLDEVIRNLYKKTTKEEANTCKNWFCYFNGRSYLDMIEDELIENLTHAPPTEYYEIIKKLPFITIISCQAMHWRPLSDIWIYEHFDRNRVKIIYVNDPEIKLAYLKEGDVLVDDYPYFSDFSQIAVVDYPYNSRVRHVYRRIKTPEDMEALIRQHYGGSE